MLILSIILIISIFINFMFLLINMLMSNSYKMNYLKMSSFECGFETFESTRLPFSINFYLIAILFLTFDVEIIFLLPIISIFNYMNFILWIIYSLFIITILFIGLEFEKKEGSLKWLF